MLVLQGQSAFRWSRCRSIFYIRCFMHDIASVNHKLDVCR